MKITTYIKWVDVKYHNGYKVSNNGLVKKGNVLLSQKPDTQGRLRVCFRDSFRSTKKYLDSFSGETRVHRLVYAHFGKDEIKDGYHIHHIDGNYLNNHIDNLLQVSPEEHRKIHSKSFR